MFVGHYGPSFAIRSIQPATRLWVLFIAVQLLDVSWSVLVFAGIEKVRIVPGITASNPFDLYYMPFTHSLVAALAWSLVTVILYRLLAGLTCPCTTTRQRWVSGCGTIRHLRCPLKRSCCSAGCLCICGEPSLSVLWDGLVHRSLVY
jgi:hypothetical protein